jgi:hypothetical protein
MRLQKVSRAKISPPSLQAKQIPRWMFMAIQERLIQLYGDEAHDIGDAADIVNLIENTCADPQEDPIVARDGPCDFTDEVHEVTEPHESYTIATMRYEIAHVICYLSREDKRWGNKRGTGTVYNGPIEWQVALMFVNEVATGVHKKRRA